MPTVTELAEQIDRLDPTERALLLRRLDRLRPITELGPDSFGLPGLGPGVTKTPGVCGGDACVANTRIPVWLLAEMRQLGMTEATILQNYPTLRAIDLVQAWAYADAHPDEMERLIRENEEA